MALSVSRGMVHVRRRMHEELKGVGASTRLAAQVAACVGKALRLLAEKAEYMAATGARALSPYGEPPPRPFDHVLRLCSMERMLNCDKVSAHLQSLPKLPGALRHSDLWPCLFEWSMRHIIMT